MSNARCTEKVYGDWHSYQCSRRGGLVYKGKAFCKQHYPPEVERKSKERREKWDMKWDKEVAEDKRRSACLKYCKNLSIEQLEKRIKEGEFAK